MKKPMYRKKCKDCRKPLNHSEALYNAGYCNDCEYELLNVSNDATTNVDPSVDRSVGSYSA